MIGFGTSAMLEQSPRAVVLEIEWLTSLPSLRAVLLSRADFNVFGDALIAAMKTGDVYWLKLDAKPPRLAVLHAVRDGQVYDS